MREKLLRPFRGQVNQCAFTSLQSEAGELMASQLSAKSNIFFMQIFDETLSFVFFFSSLSNLTKISQHFARQAIKVTGIQVCFFFTFSFFNKSNNVKNYYQLPFSVLIYHTVRIFTECVSWSWNVIRFWFSVSLISQEKNEVNTHCPKKRLGRERKRKRKRSEERKKELHANHLNQNIREIGWV